MKSTTRILSAATVFVGMLYCGAAQAQVAFDKVTLKVDKVAPNVYTITGTGLDPDHPETGGGRITFLTGTDGVFMVDSQFAPMTDKVVAAIKTVSSAPIRFVVNTHAHPDHSGGNANLAKLGAVILAREEARTGMEKPLPPPARAATAPATDATRLPIVTYGMGDPLKLRLDGEVIDLVPLPPAHTDGDTMIRLETTDVLVVGDFFRSYGYPFADPNLGGTVKGIVAALDIAIKLAGPKTIVVPGHGAVVGKTELVATRAMLVDLQSKVGKLIASGKTTDQIIAAKLTAPYDASVPGASETVPAALGAGTTADRLIKAIDSEQRTHK